MSTAAVVLLVPRLLAGDLGGVPRVELAAPADGTLRGLLDDVAGQHPAFDRRVRDETGTLRRHVNVYVDGEDVRRGGGLDSSVAPGAEVQVIQSVAGG